MASYDIHQVTRYVLVNKDAGKITDVAEFPRRDEADRALQGLYGHSLSVSDFRALEAAFAELGPYTMGEPNAYADAERTNPYVAFKVGGPSAAEAAAHMVKDILSRRISGTVLWRTLPEITRNADGAYIVYARLTFTGGMLRGENAEGRAPKFI